MVNAFVAALALCAGAAAISIKRGGTCSCSFHLTSSGHVAFPIGEDEVGEVLGGSKEQQASFCLNGNTIVDANGNGCWFTPPTYVLQCDKGATAAVGFAIACNGEVSYNGQTTFYECENGIGDEVNLYLKPDEGVKCGSITLTADNCHAACPTTCAAQTVTVTETETCTISVCPTTAAPPPPPPPPPVTTTTVAPPPPPQSTCPMDLPSGFEFPHLIVPIDSSKPSAAAGTSYFGEVSSTVSSLFNFDIPASDAGKQCTLWFLLPAQAQLTTSSFTLSGSGSVDFASLASVATQATTFASAPAVAADLGQVTLVPGNAYKVATFECPAGKTVSYEMKAVGDTAFKFFQDYNPCPIGLYIVPS